jgi:hypothetical protein
LHEFLKKEDDEAADRVSSRVAESLRAPSRVAESVLAPSRVAGSSRAPSRIAESIRAASQVAESYVLGKAETPEGVSPGTPEGGDVNQDSLEYSSA